MPAVGGQHKVDALVFFGGFLLTMFTSFFNLLGILLLIWLLILCFCEISLHENVCLFIWVYFLYLCFTLPYLFVLPNSVAILIFFCYCCPFVFQWERGIKGVHLGLWRGGEEEVGETGGAEPWPEYTVWKKCILNKEVWLAIKIIKQSIL